MKKLLLVLGAFCAFLVGYGATSTSAYSGTIHGRTEHRGYFTNAGDTCGAEVLGKYYRSGTEAIREDVNDAESFIQFIKHTKLDLDGNGSGDGVRDKTGAAFIIHTMIGTPLTSPSQRYRPPNAGQIADWERRVRAADAEGRVNWRTNYSFTINSYWQGNGCGTNPNDAAFYDEADTMPSIVFRDRDGSVGYALKWECGNPVGTSMGPLEPANQWSMTGRSTVSDATPRAGDTITFRHYVRNAGPQATTPRNVWSSVLSHPSNAQIQPGQNNGTFAAGQEKLVDTINHTIPPGTAPGTQICQKVLYDWANWLGARNGIGAPACATVQYDFDLTPSIEVDVNSVPASEAEEGDTIRFRYIVRNAGSTISQSTACDIYGRTVSGSYSSPTPINSTSVGYSAPPTGCPRTFPAASGGVPSTTTLVTETIASAPANSTICRSLFVNPNAPPPGGVREGTEICVRVVSRPYLKVYGGDVSAGGGVATTPHTCTNNSDAAIATWNKRGGGSYAGAGAQYAAFALSTIHDFASAQGAGSSAAAPVGLSFANTAFNLATGNFGGSFGSAPCIKDYYAEKPSTTTGLSFVESLTDKRGSYSRSGPMIISASNINPGDRLSVYVDGDVLIMGNIIYPPASWTIGDIPSLRLVVKGNIYIASTVTRLDGVYIAQPDGSAGGTITTCATSSVLLPLGGSLYSTCNNQLTVNGAFVARNVELLRTRGTVGRSTAGEASNNNIAEVFNYSPVFWIPQQGSGPGAGKYDAITSLPPVL